MHKLNVPVFSVICCVLALMSAPVNAEVHHYHPSVTVELGKPYDSFRPDLDVRSNGFFEWSESGFEQEPGLSDLQFEYSEIESIDQLYKSLKLDINAEAKFGLTSGSASLSKTDDYEFSGRNLTIVLTAFREFKEQRKKGDLKLSKLGLDRLKQSDETGSLFLWRQVSGSEVVSSFVRGASTSIIYQFKTSSTSKKDSLKAALSAAWTSGSANADFLQTAKSLDNDYSVKINYNQIGGGTDVSSLQQLIKSNPGNIVSLRSVLSNSLNNVNEKNAKLLYYKTTTVDSIGDVVFGTNGKISEVTNHFSNVLKARSEHFRRLLVVNSRLDEANKLLSSKPTNSFNKDGIKDLETLITKLNKIRADIADEYGKYDVTDPKKALISLNAGASIPRIVPTKFFSPPFAKLASWNNSVISAVRCGTKPFDCEFHDFYQYFYPNIEVIHPSFVERIRLMKNCDPVATVRSSEMNSFIANGSNFETYFKSNHKREGVYTWGANNLPAERNNSINIFAAAEGKNKYILEVTDTEAFTHFVDIGSYGNTKNSIINNIADVCGNL